MKKLKNYMFLTIVCAVLSVQTAFASRLLVPGGQVIGLEVQDGTLSVAGFDEQMGQNAKNCGLQLGDRILRIDGSSVSSPGEIQNKLNVSDGQVELSILRGKEEKTIRFQPSITSEGPKLGVYLRQGVTGVGTVTWYDPATDRFGALGHGVNTPDGKLVKMTRGNVYTASVLSVKQGRSGTPGQLMSTVTGTSPIGTVFKNTVQGVFGSASLSKNAEALPVGGKGVAHTGKATIRSTVDGTQTKEYEIEILKIYKNADETGRNMLLKVTDPALLAATGGIVQGMSGSPIIQDGKLIGAVTHVLVNDPTTGYGIFIENMLDAAA